MKHFLDLSKLARPTALRVWMLYNKITATRLSKDLSVDPSFICRVLSGEKNSERVAACLLKMGAPKALLPRKVKRPASSRRKNKRALELPETDPS